ncbi:nicotinate phosphoribosyltransferase [Anaerofilum sp. An201]|nr:nicotinate phosphoribosyltransferase [Anaerofilum sp. An201]OUP04610.1 nicotinate phosphoribosyltransferase [Anaerofilum sp. An201]
MQAAFTPDPSRNNPAMMMDFYEMTMANAYFLTGLKDTRVVYDMFFRRVPDGGGYALAVGQESLVRHLLDFHFAPEDIAYFASKGIFDPKFLEYLSHYRFGGSVYCVPEGSVVYPNETLIRVEADAIGATLIETQLLTFMNHQSRIATKASRICRGGRVVMEFGSRRAQGNDAANLGARAAYIAGAAGTANCLADQKYGVPALGTMAHAFVEMFPTEYDAFAAYARIYPDSCTLLVDTYDVLHSGIPNAIRIQNEVLSPMGKRMKGVRLDSGDLAYLSKKVRRILDAAGMEDCKICVSNGLDEFTMADLERQGAVIDSYGIGERLITAASDPVFGGVYKLCAVEENGQLSPRIKVSENEVKTTNPGKKMVWRLYNKDTGFAICDVITLDDEEIPEDVPYSCVDPRKPWKNIVIEDFTAVRLLVPYLEDGKLVRELPSLDEIRAYSLSQLKNEVWEEEQRLYNPHIHYVNMSHAAYALKIRMCNEHQA